MSGLSSDLLLDLIGDVYRAALAPGDWPRVLLRIGDAYDGAAVHFGIQRLPIGILLVTYVRIDPARMAIFQRDYGSEASNLGLAKLLTLTGDDLLTSEQMFGDHEDYHRSHLYNEVIKPQGLDHFAQVNLVRGSGHIVPFVRRPRPGRASIQAGAWRWRARRCANRWRWW